MANTILHKKSSTASAVPSAGSLALGEIAINTADGRAFVKTGAGVVVDVGRPTAAVLLNNVADQAITGGARVTSLSLGTITTGTVTPDPGDRPMQHYTNNGAHTLAPGSNAGSYILDITNGASAGAITVSGWTKVAGDPFTTTNTEKFRCHCSVGNAGSLIVVQALQ